jgi:PAS domain-containing protein
MDATDDSPVALLVIAPSGEILDASESALRLLDLERSAVVGQTADAIDLLPLPWHDHVPGSTDAKGLVRR